MKKNMKPIWIIIVILIIILTITSIILNLYIKDIYIENIKKIEAKIPNQPKMKRLDLSFVKYNNEKIIMVGDTKLKLPYSNLILESNNDNKITYSNDELNVIFNIVGDIIENRDSFYKNNVAPEINATNNITLINMKDIERVFNKYDTFLSLRKESYENKKYNYNYFTDIEKLKNILILSYLKSKNIKADELYYFKIDKKEGIISTTGKDTYIEFIDSPYNINSINIIIKEDSSYKVTEDELRIIINSIEK